jgi:hypothetical protein
MKGIPKNIRARGDIDNLLSYIGTPHDTPEARAAILAQLQAIRATHQHYVFTRTLAGEADRAGPEPYYRVLSNQGESGDEIHEYQLDSNPHSRLSEIGMTPAELDALIEEIA